MICGRRERLVAAWLRLRSPKDLAKPRGDLGPRGGGGQKERRGWFIAPTLNRGVTPQPASPSLPPSLPAGRPAGPDLAELLALAERLEGKALVALGTSIKRRHPSLTGAAQSLNPTYRPASLPPTAKTTTTTTPALAQGDATHRRGGGDSGRTWRLIDSPEV